MPTLEENVNRVKAAKTAIGNAITAKGGTVGANDGLEDFAADIATIPSGGVEFSNSPSSFTLLTNIQNLDVVIPSGVLQIGEKAFFDCTGLTSIELPNTVTNIGQYAFRKTGIKSIEIPDSVLTLGNGVFYQCSKLETIKLPSNINSIPSYIADSCTKLKTIEIPNGVTNIKQYAFSYCSSLQSIKFTSTTPPTITSTSFESLPTTCKIYIPTGSLTAYTSAANYPDPNTYTYVEY